MHTHCTAKQSRPTTMQIFWDTKSQQRTPAASKGEDFEGILKGDHWPWFQSKTLYCALGLRTHPHIPVKAAYCPSRAGCPCDARQICQQDLFRTERAELQSDLRLPWQCIAVWW
uniref:Uncharacterized protein n=1 Tax=Eutreptiella gymnastica TaxID=73025 RepID=A0A7S4FP80_9EUGL|mmetsp:Transcript_21782/g.36357  ORF Transcript_21782/g.36357 Transcript_21782/m.36357 type:complete len:114 (+) Transcript_21782:179-520(+)